MSGFKQSGFDCDPYEMSETLESQAFSSSQILQSLDVDPASVGDNKLVELTEQADETFGNSTPLEQQASLKPSLQTQPSLLSKGDAH